MAVSTMRRMKAGYWCAMTSAETDWRGMQVHGVLRQASHVALTRHVAVHEGINGAEVFAACADFKLRWQSSCQRTRLPGEM